MKYIKNINEFRNELELPFDGKHPLHDKPTHIHLLDALLSIKKSNKPENYESYWTSKSIEEAWESNLNIAFEMFKENEKYDDSLKTELNYKFLETYNPLNDDEYYSDEIIEYIKNNNKPSLRDIISEFELNETLPDYLNSEGLELYNNEVMRYVFEDKLDDTSVLYIIKDNQNEDGLIPVYRAISYGKGGEIDTYTNIKNYEGVGIYWSYELDGAEPHGGSYDETYVLHGLVKPDYINWKNTIFKSAYSLNHEREIEILEDKEIMITKITEYVSDIDVKLPKPIIVKT